MCAHINKNIHYCVQCGSKLILRERFGGLRPNCPNCDWVYFPDPKVAVAALIHRNNQVLLVRRINDPQRGFWTLPAGFIDAGEDPVKAIERECFEETGLHTRVTELVDVIYGQEHPRGAHILIVYRAKVLSGQLRAADDVDKAEYFPLDGLPPLAFDTTQNILAKLIDQHGT
jgi:8-oxo-dGTP diphosphatase